MSDSNMNINVSANTEQARSALGDLKDEIGNIGKIMGGELFKGFGYVEMIEKMAGKIKETVMEIAHESKQLIRESREFNMSLQDTQRFKDEMEELGIPLSMAVRVKRNIEKVFAEANANTSGKKAMMIEQLGLSKEDTKRMESDGKYAMEKLREVYQSFKSEQDASAFGQSMFGTAFLKFRPYLESSAEESREGSAGVSKLSNEMALAGKNIVNTLDDMGDRFKDLVQPLVPIVSIVVESLNILFTGLVTSLKIAWSVFMIVMNGIGMSWGRIEKGFYDFVMGINKARSYLPTWLGGLSEEDYQEKVRDYQKFTSDYMAAQNTFVQGMIDNGDTIEKAMEKGNELTKKSVSNIQTAGSSFSEKIGVTKEGSAARDMLNKIQNMQKQVKEYDDAVAEVQKRKSKDDYFKSSVEQINKDQQTIHGKNGLLSYEIEKIRKESKELQKEYDAIYKLRQDFNRDTGKQYTDFEAELRKRDKDIEDLARKQKADEAVANERGTKAKLETQQKHLEEMKKMADEELASIESTYGENSKAYYLNIQKKWAEEYVAIEKRMAETRKKLREEERKQQSEDIAYNQKVRDKILSIEDKSRQLNYDKMKKEGATESDILNQKFEELTNESERLYNEYFNAREQALADPLNKEKRENALNLFGSAFEKTIDAQKTMLGASGSFGGFIASDMAKKGLGGGVTGLGVPTMVDLNKKQVEKLTGIIAVLNEIKNRNLLNVPVATVSPDTPTSQTP